MAQSAGNLDMPMHKAGSGLKITLMVITQTIGTFRKTTENDINALIFRATFCREL